MDAMQMQLIFVNEKKYVKFEMYSNAKPTENFNLKVYFDYISKFRSLTPGFCDFD